ncbi:hypothetical protein U1Q18_031710 [Sarracenia purpurea var. burkii]
MGNGDERKEATVTSGTGLVADRRNHSAKEKNARKIGTSDPNRRGIQDLVDFIVGSVTSISCRSCRQHAANSGRRLGRETGDGRITVEEKKSSEEPGVFPERHCVQRRCTAD